MGTRTLVYALLAVCAPAVVLAGEAAPAFARKPAVTRDGAGARIEFAAAAPTDCAVYVLGADGRVVRHLAAGVLGDKAPEPLKPGLAQALVWDGKDDLGKPAAGGPFKVRVALGLRPQLEGFIGGNPASLGGVVGLGASAKGEVFALHIFGTLHPSDNTASISVFDREGKYLRTILPYPADLPDGKLKGVRRIELDGGAKVPFLYHAENRMLVPCGGDLQEQTLVVSSDGRVGFVAVLESPMRYAQAGPVHLMVINADGSVPDDGCVRTQILPRGVSAALALSPDEKTIYASDVRTPKDHYGIPVNVVFKFGWDDKTAVPFVDGKSADGDSKLSDPKGICTDKDGNVFVCDKGNDRVAIFKPDGSFLGAVKTTRPERVAVHPKTGAVYVLGGAGINELAKYESWKASAPAATAKLGTFKHAGYRVSMTLEATGEKPSLWFCSGKGGYSKVRFLRIEDQGGSFGAQVEVSSLAANKGEWAGDTTNLSYSRQADVLQVGNRFYDVKAGKFAQALEGRASKIVASIGLDGNLYAQVYPRAVQRFGPDLKPLPFPNGTKGAVEDIGGNMRLRGRGVTADALGNVYNLWQKPDKAQTNALAVFGPDGKARSPKLIDADIRSLNSVRCDYRGNIYLALGLRPGKDRLPPALKGKVAEDRKDPAAMGGLNPYPMIYGSIAKFGPDGGEILKGNGGEECNYAFGTVTNVKGAKWIFPGASNVPSWRTPGTPDICLCESPRFDVDGFGRSFFPDAGCFRAGVIDSAGNGIAWFGTYGNPDSGGPKSAVPVPEIPFQWPHAVAVGPDTVYVGDRLNRRVVKVKLGYAAEETCTVR